ncbi:hypothetical protein BJF93_15100 [Xaviernesmea oryzae]|uniref:Uncharacterized protein n=1 Tax=Xaviernesmea oryzae TaxID=464029 RepID=A0A1Q9AXY2_9HYPH|nr:hypothetical protein [Xaviernesmea oryzae]OLP60285.1 hypothetical protein BJF93_15100 [Xaviernesmea oryzae]
MKMRSLKSLSTSAGPSRPWNPTVFAEGSRHEPSFCTEKINHAYEQTLPQSPASIEPSSTVRKKDGALLLAAQGCGNLEGKRWLEVEPFLDWSVLMARRPLFIILILAAVVIVAMLAMRSPGNMNRDSSADQTQPSPHAIQQSQ